MPYEPELTTPCIIVNYKTYNQGFGPAGLELTRSMEELAEASGVCLAAAAGPVDVANYAAICKVPVLAQHVDPATFGSFTGAVLAEAVAAYGAVGTLVNHSERRLQLADIGKVLDRCRQNKLLTVLCTDTVATTASGAALHPDYLAVEPPELIGGDISVSTARPEVVSGAVEAAREVAEGQGTPVVPVLCGAGVKTRTDVAKAMELGAQGILLASGVVKAVDPKSVLEDLIQGLG